MDFVLILIITLLNYKNMIKRRTPINKVLFSLIILAIVVLGTMFNLVNESMRLNKSPNQAESQIRIDTIWNGNDIAYTKIPNYKYIDGSREFRIDTAVYTIECYTILRWDVKADTLTDYRNYFYKVQKMEMK